MSYQTNSYNKILSQKIKKLYKSNKKSIKKLQFCVLGNICFNLNCDNFHIKRFLTATLLISRSCLGVCMHAFCFWHEIYDYERTN